MLLSFSLLCTSLSANLILVCLFVVVGLLVMCACVVVVVAAAAAAAAVFALLLLTFVVCAPNIPRPPGGGRRELYMGGLGGDVNSLDFCPASLKSLGCFYFRCVLSSQWKAVTVNLRIFPCNFKDIFGGPNSRSSGQPKKRRKDTFFSTFHPLSTVIFATAAVLAFVLLRNSRFIFHCYIQREATPTQKSA